MSTKLSPQALRHGATPVSPPAQSINLHTSSRCKVLLSQGLLTPEAHWVPQGCGAASEGAAMGTVQSGPLAGLAGVHGHLRLLREEEAG